MRLKKKNEIPFSIRIKIIILTRLDLTSVNFWFMYIIAMDISADKLSLEQIWLGKACFGYARPDHTDYASNENISYERLWL